MSRLIGIGCNIYQQGGSGSGGPPCEAGCYGMDSSPAGQLTIPSGSGMADTKTYTASMWFKLHSDAGTGPVQIYSTTNQRIKFNRVGAAGGNVMTWEALNSSGTTIVDLESVTAVTDDAWHHIIVSVDHLNGFSHLYLNGSSDKSIITAVANDTADFTDTAELIPKTLSKCAVSNLWVSSEYIDLSVNANLERFIKAGAPQALGADGSDASPTSTQPEHCLIFDNASNFGDNLGSSIDWTTSGTPAQVSGPGA